MTEQRPGDPGVEGGDPEGEDPVPEEVDPHDLRRDVVVPDRHERPARPGPHDVHGEQHHHDRDREDQVVEGAVRIEDVPADRGARDDDPERSARHRLPPQEDPFEDELGRQRRDGEVQPLEAQRGDAEDHSGRRGDQPRRRDADPEGEPHLGGHVGRRVRPDAEEGPLPEGDLPRVPGQDVEPHGADDRDEDLEADPEVLPLHQERKDHQEGETRRDADPDGRRLEDLDVLLVGGAEIAAVMHVKFSLG